MNTSYIGIFFVLRETRCIGCQMRWFTFNSSNLCLLISWHPRNWNYNIWEIHMQFIYHLERKYQMICHWLHLIPGCLIKGGKKFEIFEPLQFQKIIWQLNFHSDWTENIINLWHPNLRFHVNCAREMEEIWSIEWL